MKDRLVRERDHLFVQMEALKNKIAGLELAISLIGTEEDTAVLQANGKRVATKSVVLDLLSDVGSTGLNAMTAVEMAARRGVVLDRGSVSSLLSRLKKDEVVDHDGEKYKLKGRAIGVLARSDGSTAVFPPGMRKAPSPTFS